MGNCAEDIYCALLKARREGKRVVLLYYRQLPWKLRLELCNQELLKIKSPYLINHQGFLLIFSEWVLTFIYTLTYYSNLLWRKIVAWRMGKMPSAHYKYILPTIGRKRLWTPEGVTEFSWRHFNKKQWIRDHNEYLPVFMDPQKKAVAESIRVNEIGVPLTDWFVCLHVREAGFRNELKYNHLRNGTIANYIEGIKAVTDRGGWVVRLGDPSMTALPPMSRVIDYARSPFKSPLMDIYFMSECRYMIGTNSGPQDVTQMFQKRELLINVTEWLYTWPIRAGDKLILKHVYSNALGRYLSLEELFNSSHESLYYFHAGQGTYSLHENTSAEIRDAIIEFLDEPVESRHTPLQEIVKRTRENQIQTWLSEGFVVNGKPALSDMEKYRVASSLSYQGTISHSYLEGNWSWNHLTSSIHSLENSHVN